MNEQLAAIIDLLKAAIEAGQTITLTADGITVNGDGIVINNPSISTES